MHEGILLLGRIIEPEMLPLGDVDKLANDLKELRDKHDKLLVQWAGRVANRCDAWLITSARDRPLGENLNTAVDGLKVLPEIALPDPANSEEAPKKLRSASEPWLKASSQLRNALANGSDSFRAMAAEKNNFLQDSCETQTRRIEQFFATRF